MFKSVEMTNFGGFAEPGRIEFARGLTVIIGENGTGKSHLMKVPYCIMAACWEAGRKQGVSAPTKALLQPKLADKLVGVLRPEHLGRLVRRTRGVSRCEVSCRFSQPAHNIDLSFTTRSQGEVVVDRLPTAWVEQPPVFIPTRELLTIYPGFLALYDTIHLEVEETWRDTCRLLGAPAVKGRREELGRRLLEPLESAMAGRVVERLGRFYLDQRGQGTIEMPLVAEGVRKLAMLARLIATGSLLDKNCLFWDEPETNLNARLIRCVADAIVRLCGAGIQIVIGTHSLFLMRELDLLLRSPGYDSVDRRFISLDRGDDGVVVQQGDSIDAVGEIAALHEDMLQSDRYLNAEAAAHAPTP